MQPPSPSAPHDAEPRRRSLNWLWLPVLFVAGLVAGGVIVAVFSDGTTASQTTPRPTLTITRRPPAPSGTQVQISTSCLRAIQDAQAAYRLLTRAATAVGNLDAAALGELAQKAQTVQRRLGADLHSCQATVQLPATSPGATPSR